MFQWHVQFPCWTNQREILYYKLPLLFYFALSSTALSLNKMLDLLLFFGLLNRGKSLLSSNMARRLGGVKGVSFSPTNPIRLLLLISSTNCRGVPKSRWCLNAKGCVLYILNPMDVAAAIKVLSALKLTELMISAFSVLLAFSIIRSIIL